MACCRVRRRDGVLMVFCPTAFRESVVAAVSHTYSVFRHVRGARSGRWSYSGRSVGVARGKETSVWVADRRGIKRGEVGLGFVTVDDRGRHRRVVVRCRSALTYLAQSDWPAPTLWSPGAWSLGCWCKPAWASQRQQQPFSRQGQQRARDEVR